MLNFKITKNPDQAFHVLQSIGTERVPDNQHTFCLDHLRSALASDEIRVFKNRLTVEEGSPTGEIDFPITAAQKRVVKKISQDSTPFLQLVASKAVDHTAGIIRRFIRTAFILLTNKATFAPARSAVGIASGTDIVVADFQVDPFDYQEMARVNEAVRKFGFCFVLEDYTFDRSRSGGTMADKYCRAPREVVREKPPPAAEAIGNLHYLVPKPVDGVFFRPRASYRLSIYTKDDPDGRGVWRLGRIVNLSMENIMPIVSVGVGRAVFATRRTGLVFDDGTLTNVCISKGSEIEGAIQIPLEVIYGIIALPSEMILATINDATTTRDLLVAQRRLVDAQNLYIKYLNREIGLDGLTKSADASKRGKLVLGSTVPTGADATTFTNDEPPDAGPIFASTNGDALSEICAELAVASTAGTAAAPTTPGHF